MCSGRGELKASTVKKTVEWIGDLIVVVAAAVVGYSIYGMSNTAIAITAGALAATTLARFIDRRRKQKAVC